MPVDSARVLIHGLAFKENCPDLRNSHELDVIAELRDFFLAVDVHDTWINPEAARAGYGFAPVQTPQAGL
ncbi:UDP binding domain-containing protein [Salibaculum halophilum]|uniref:UDP binding domain-containing protein n=1 Tax=Salibaculum halophilum TaxID=1914408 RepID=UPI000A111F91|nr:UDP binding domain-containing protein [Salibaculum halophilum]